MSFIISHLTSLPLLWVLIVYFTRSLDNKQSFREAFICTLGLAVISMIFAWFVFVPFNLLRFPVQMVALYFLIDRVCECSVATTWRIVIWYLVISVTFGVLFYLLRQFLDS
jgi:hypothetical protein